MRRTLSLLASSGAAAGLIALSSATPAAADLGCPNDMTPAPAALVNNGDKKDKNGNGTICVKPATCLEMTGPVCHGGPDDERFGLPVLGTDNVWYYATDDVV
jgi:hypothetical protein